MKKLKIISDKKNENRLVLLWFLQAIFVSISYLCWRADIIPDKIGIFLIPALSFLFNILTSCCVNRRVLNSNHKLIVQNQKLYEKEENTWRKERDCKELLDRYYIEVETLKEENREQRKVFNQKLKEKIQEKQQEIDSLRLEFIYLKTKKVKNINSKNN